jgi:hypothetical protein
MAFWYIFVLVLSTIAHVCVTRARVAEAEKRCRQKKEPTDWRDDDDGTIELVPRGERGEEFDMNSGSLNVRYRRR